MRLTRDPKGFTPTGIFGVLTTDDGVGIFAHTLEHAYHDVNNPDPVANHYIPKVPPGTYTCVRGMHELAGMAQPFETFEITGVTGHTDILFHSGNTNADSAGCVLLGLQRVGDEEILQSRVAFQNFMELTKYVDSFELIVS